MHASDLGTRTPISIQRRLGSALGCPVLASSQWFLENLQELAHDRGILVFFGEANVKDFFELLKECTSLLAIGAQPRMMSWFSLNTSIKFLLPGFTLNRFYEEDAGPLEEPAATIDGAAAKAQYSEELRRLKKGYNRIALAAKLLMPWLRHEMMLYMKVTDAHWLAFGTLASLKLNGENHRKYAHNMATGQWYFVLRESR